MKSIANHRSRTAETYMLGHIRTKHQNQLHSQKKLKRARESDSIDEKVFDDYYDVQSVSYDKDDVDFDLSVQSFGSDDSKDVQSFGSNIDVLSVSSSESSESESWSSDDDFPMEKDETPKSLADDIPGVTIPNVAEDNARYLYGDFAFLKPPNSEYRDNNQLYFYEQYRARELNENDGTGGYRSLCYRATAGRDITDASQLASDRFSKLMFRLNSALLSAEGSTGALVMELVESMCDEFQQFVDDKLGDNTVPVVPEHFPQSFVDARRIILDGRSSVMENFPAPKVFVIGQHACVSLKETIQHMAGHRGSFDFAYDARTQKRSTDGLNGTKAAGRVIIEVMDFVKQNNGDPRTSIGIMTLWSDSYLQSFIKQKDQSVWLLTVTISPPKGDISKGTYTQVLAIGKKSQDHTDVINHYWEEIKNLQKGFDCYLACSNSIEKVAFGLAYWSTDRPERQYVLNTLGEGTYGKITGYSAQVCTDRLPACKECFSHIVDNVNKSRCLPRACKRCFCWNIDPNDESQEVSPVPEGYPSHTELEDEEGSPIMPPVGREPGRKVLGPIKLSSDWLITACSFAYEARRLKIWTKKEFHAYLRTCCVCESRRNIIENQALLDGKNKTRSAPKSYLPTVWLACNVFDRFLFPDMPMHALAHGIGDDVIHFIHSILTEFKQGTAYGDFANDIISDIDAFNLDWCKPKTYPKSAWVGENIMAYLRLSSYLYGMFIMTTSFFGEYVTLMNAVERLINAFQAMLSILMSDKPRYYQEYDLLREHVKLFLSTAHYCETELKPISQDRSKGSNNKGGPFDDLTNTETSYLLHKLNIEPGRSPRKTLDRVTVKDLRGYLYSMGVGISGSGKKKSELQSLLIATLLDKEINCPSVPNEDSSMTVKENLKADNPEDRDKNEQSLVWNKGAWLSFVTNISEQIKFLGPLIWIW